MAQDTAREDAKAKLRAGQTALAEAEAGFSYGDETPCRPRATRSLAIAGLLCSTAS